MNRQRDGLGVDRQGIDSKRKEVEIERKKEKKEDTLMRGRLPNGRLCQDSELLYNHEVLDVG